MRHAHEFFFGIEQNERLISGVVDLGHAGQELVGELAHRHEEAQADVVGRDLGQHLGIAWLVVGPDRPEEDLMAVEQRFVPLPLNGIGPDRGRRDGHLGRVLDLDAGVEREQALGAGHQRIDESPDRLR